jgi:hypothetical protein
MLPPSPGRWPRRNVVCVAVFGPVLIVTGLLGLVLPAGMSLMSVALPYDVFHIAFGLLGTSIALSRRPGAAALFNLGFGAIDLYQALAGALGLFPAALFALRPADHVVHVVLGAALVMIGALGLARR